MLQNGNLTIFRVLASFIIGITTVAGSIWLLHEGVDIPFEYWTVAMVAIGGVVGIDVVVAVLTGIKNRKEL